MKEIIINLINVAEHTKNFDTKEEILKEIKNLIYKLATTYNAPSDWRYIAEELAEEYKNNSFVYEMLQLWDYEE